MRFLIASLVTLSISFSAFAQNPCSKDPQPWYITHPSMVHNLWQALAEDRAYLSYHFDLTNHLVKWANGNPGWHMMADAKTCTALRSVGLACDYNTRSALTMFLTVNGKGIFPAEGGTNPWYTGKDRAKEIAFHKQFGGCPDQPNDSFIGQPRQNAILAAAVRRNATLFHNGDLSAADVHSRWR